MSKLVTIILIVASVTLLGLSIVVILLNQNTTPFKQSFGANPTPAIKTLLALTLSPQTEQVHLGQVNTVDIIIETQKSVDTKPRLLQMEIAYDPQALLNVDMTPGDFFTNPSVPLKIINPNNGRISYALEKSETDTTNKTTGTTARLTFTPSPLFSGKETTLTFLGKTKIRGVTDTDIITATHGTKIFFATPSATPQ